jgi:hypothetical protein
MAGDAAADRWIMTAALVAVGLCYLVTASGMTGIRRSARLLLVLAGLCSLGIAATPEPASGPTALHIAWTGIGAVTITVWPLFATTRGRDRPLPLRIPARVAAAVLFTVLLCWFLVEARYGSALGIAERASATVPTCWPFVVAIAISRLPGVARSPTANWRATGDPDGICATAEAQGRGQAGHMICGSSPVASRATLATASRPADPPRSG